MVRYLSPRHVGHVWGPHRSCSPIPAFVRARGGARAHQPSDNLGGRGSRGSGLGAGPGLQLHPNRKVENAFTVDCHPLRTVRDGEGDKRAIFVLSYRGPATVPLLSRLSKITLLIRTKTSNSTYPMRSRTSPNDAITPPRPKAWRNSRGAARIEVHSSRPRQDSTPEHEHACGERRDFRRRPQHCPRHRSTGTGCRRHRGRVAPRRTRASRRARRRSRHH